MRGGSWLAVATLILAVACGGVTGAEPEAGGAPSQRAVAGGPHYTGEVAFDRGAGRLDARFEIELVVDDTTTDGVQLLLNRGLEVTRLEVPGAGAHTVDEWPPGSDWSRYTIPFDPPHSPGERVRLELAYEGAPALPESGINSIEPDWVELSVDGAWFPLFSTFDRYLTASFRLDLPSDWKVVASGTVTTDGSGFGVDNDVPQIDIAFAAGPALRETRSDDFSVFHRGLEPAQLDRLLGAADACGAWLNDRFGQEETLPRGKLVIAPRAETGYARKNYIVLTEPGERSETSLTDFLCHELAHFWSSRGNAMTVDNWLNEGFAVFVAARYVRERFGEEAYAELRADWQERSEGQPAVWVPGDTERKSFAVNYKKAPLKLHALEQTIGEEGFAELLRRYMVDGISTTEQLLEELESIAGERAREAFVQNLGE